MRRVIIATMLTAAVWIAAPDVQAQDQGAAAIAAAQEAAKSWLALVDAANYTESWNQAAALFRGAVAQDAWGTSVGHVRGPLGAVKDRKVKSADYRTSLPGAPDGQYVVIQYTTIFERKAAAVETITPMLDADGHWRVSGYFVK